MQIWPPPAGGAGPPTTPTILWPHPKEVSLPRKILEMIGDQIHIRAWFFDAGKRRSECHAKKSRSSRRRRYRKILGLVFQADCMSTIRDHRERAGKQALP